MKPRFIKLCSITLILTIIVTSFCTLNISATEIDGSFEHKPYMQSLFAKTEDINGVHFYGATGDTPVDKASMPDDIEVIDSLDEYIKYINDNQTSKKDIATLSASNLPDSVDNSQSKFFPAIGNQGTLGSCTSWAQVYYQFTYTMNKEMNVATTPDNTFSPQWAYNLVAGTGDMIGPYYNTYAFMKKQGNVFLNQVPYDFNITSFSPTEDIWKTSIKYRIKDYQNFNNIGLEDSRITTANDEDLTLIKTALNNGDVLAYSTCIYSWQTTSIKTKSEISENNKFKGQYAVTSQIGENGPHRMTLVGYNDNIWIDVNNNNAVDNGEMGAFKIANSWGSNYGNNGFMWIAYDALNKESCVDGTTNDDSRRAIFENISRIEVYPYNTGTDLYLRYTLNTCDRTQCRVYLDAEKDGTIYSTPAYSNEYGGSKLAYDGSTNATDATMVLLLSNAVEGITADNLNEYTWRVRFEDTSEDGNIYTIKNAEIISEKDNKVYRPKDVYPITLDGNSKEVMLAEDNLNHAVIYYRGYDDPMLSYKVGNGNFTTDVELIHNAERRGYTHKYVIDLGSSDSATVYFSDSKGNTDNNSGKYFKATDGLNYFVTENVGTPVSLSIENNINNLADVDQYGTFE
ncbi:MAG: hypothetical protein IKB73_02290, partial [Ruminococcus sp.]|nr:hypothetical protein [Ruminococcus sp.]